MLLGNDPTPSTNLSSTGSSFLARLPRRFFILFAVSPGCNSVSGPKIGGEEKTSFSSSIAVSACGFASKCTVSATPSGSVVGSIAKGNFWLPKRTSTICP